MHTCIVGDQMNSQGRFTSPYLGSVTKPRPVGIRNRPSLSRNACSRPSLRGKTPLAGCRPLQLATPWMLHFSTLLSRVSSDGPSQALDPHQPLDPFPPPLPQPFPQEDWSSLFHCWSPELLQALAAAGEGVNTFCTTRLLQKTCLLCCWPFP